jgi:hypothetical protein
VGYQNEEVDGADPTLAGKRHGAGLVVIDEIGYEEKKRRRECGKHGDLVSLYMLSSLDEHVADDQKTKRYAVQCCIDRGKLRG